MTKTVFIGGSRKSNLTNNLPNKIVNRIDKIIQDRHEILIGDAYGLDSLIQEYLLKKNYENVIVTYSGDRLRNKKNPKWKAKFISNTTSKKDEKSVQTIKDTYMAKIADYGLMAWSDTYINERFKNKCVSSGTMLNIINLLSQNKKVWLYYIPNDKEYLLERCEDFENIIFPLLDPQAQKKWKELLQKKEKNTVPTLF